MSQIISHIHTTSTDYKDNYAHNKALAEQLCERQRQAAADRPQRTIDRQRARNKLLVRERIETLLDDSSPFLELSTLACWDMYKGEAPGAGIVTGVGRVQSVECMIIANDPTVKGGTYFPENFVPIQEAGQYNFLNGDTQITKHVSTVVTRGHTPGHQSVILENGSEPVMFLADFASYSVHFSKTAWVTAYDVEPLETIASKEQWQPWAYESDALLVFQHDITTRAGKLVKDEKGRYQIEAIKKVRSSSPIHTNKQYL